MTLITGWPGRVAAETLEAHGIDAVVEKPVGLETLRATVATLIERALGTTAVRRPLAAIDLGTNTVRILVADPDPAAGLRPLWADQTVTRLGEGLTERGTLAPAAADRTLAAVRRFRERALALGAAEVLLVATAAVRQARDGREFLARLRAEPGINPRVVSGEEEAGLTLLGASWGLGGVAGTFALLDIGGGSTEVLVAEGGRVLEAVSLALGVVQLVERFFVHDPVTTHELDACRAYVDARLRDEAWDRVRPHRPGDARRDRGHAHDARRRSTSASPDTTRGACRGTGWARLAIARLTDAARRAPARRARPDAGARARAGRRHRAGRGPARRGPRRPRSPPSRRSRTPGSARASSSMRSGGVRRLRRHASEAGAPAPPSEQRRVPILAASCALC